MRRHHLLLMLVVLLAVGAVHARQPPTREHVKVEGLTNLTVLEGAEAATNLSDACCDAIFLRNVYHHITAVDAFNRSLVASLKPGGRVAIIDFEDRSGGQIPKGVPANRGGHGVPGHRG